MRFVIHKHDASNLHYDLRLETGDALASWVIPKGIDLTPNEKHLAIRVEDHDKNYYEFEGIIPEGQYGAGTVMVWDWGEYKLIETDERIENKLKEGKLKFRLYGEKLQGGYAMVRTKNDKEDEQWMIFKLDDKEADKRRKPLKTLQESAKTGRSLKTIAKKES